MEDCGDHEVGILAGLVGQMLGDQIFFRKKLGEDFLFGSAVGRGGACSGGFFDLRPGENRGGSAAKMGRHGGHPSSRFSKGAAAPNGHGDRAQPTEESTGLRPHFFYRPARARAETPEAGVLPGTIALPRQFFGGRCSVAAVGSRAQRGFIFQQGRLRRKNGTTQRSSLQQVFRKALPRRMRSGGYSTVTLFARLRGLSTSQPSSLAMW
jgi:hypothetical protein